MPRRHYASKTLAGAILLMSPLVASAQTTTADFASAAAIASGPPLPLMSRALTETPIESRPLAETPIEVQVRPSKRVSIAENPRVLRSLRFAFIGVQALDVHSTHLALQGGQESNAVMRPFTAAVPLSLALKAGMTILVYKASVAAEKRHDKRMFWVLVASDVAMGMIAIHNYRVAR